MAGQEFPSTDFRHACWAERVFKNLLIEGAKFGDFGYLN